jgi:ABC-type multidrug transport system fused ATPase/permease subunit
VATLVALRAIHGPLNNAAARLMDIQANRSSFERIRDLLRVEPAVADRPEAVPFADSLNALRFEDVGFRYGAARDVLRHVSFEVRRGQRVGIVGPSGSGKTTLLHVVARLYDPTTGRVVVNGRDLRDYRIADWHDRVAVVTQDSFVFTTTVRENIRYGRLDASPEDVERAAVDAAIHGDIVRLPLGYDTVLGVGGHTLSSGQVQRISLARALLKNAELLLLDEATSNLDAIADAQLREAVDRLRRGRTTIAVAHRLASVSDADLILVVDGGVIVATGTHQSLLTTCPLYAALWRSQFADIEHAASTHPGDSASVGASA